MDTALDILTTVASSKANASWLAIEERGDRGLFLQAKLDGYDGDVEIFSLEVAARGANAVDVHEQPSSRRLPSACPERHINSDGSFCLGPKYASIETVGSAEKWWSDLAGFLELQLRADETGSWPAACAWPHGDAAAAQEELEAARRSLPRRVARALEGARVRHDGRLFGRRLRCPCGKKRQVRRCHEKAILSVISFAAEVVRREEAFWKTWSRPCCRTMKSCPLNRSVG